MTALRITGGEVYDPANGIDGAVRDICIDGGRIVDSLPAPPAVYANASRDIARRAARSSSSALTGTRGRTPRAPAR